MVDVHHATVEIDGKAYEAAASLNN